MELPTGGREQVLVPLAALRRDPAGEFVFVYEDDGTVAPQAGGEAMPAHDAASRTPQH